ncbi:quinone oxidoreductase family protein [Candidatus Anaplasma sp. TIGMIC]|uniref:quinone oxidoreductase family protein n=1 Tax=Candidatus Anaplasma sp. TIGMIC TaxID=3020713 RepID=UPI0023304E21|nr:quinone oxidoreductase [Candidatus Anaplasma sp. TIGMIC]MDB1135199.1 quinone oxidoreductase [Candidatus Anaplasma sp. TIGMIC]
MAKAVVIEKTGAPDVMRFVDVDVGEPGTGEVLVEHTAIGLNRFDIECRSGARKPGSPFPYTPGVQAVGVVRQVGLDVEALNVGDRVGYCTARGGAYSECRIIDQKYLFKISNSVDDDVAAACMFKAMTAHYLTHRVYDVRPGTFALVHGVTGGVGNILCQWARYKGCKVVGVVSSAGGVNAAKEAGCAYVVEHNDPNASKEIMSITGGKGVNVVYDPIGKDVSHLSFSVLGVFGLYISFGQISGAIQNLSTSMLSTRSWFVASPSIYHYKHSRLELGLTAMEVFEVIRRGHIRVDVGRVFAFKDIVKAHTDLENRKLVGNSIISLK